MLTLDTKKKAIALIALMMVSALAGCLGNDDDDTDDSSNTNNTNTDTGNNTTTPVDTGVDVGTVACAPNGSIRIAGSSTVPPLAEIGAECYHEHCEGVTNAVEGGGSGGGAGRVCANCAKGTPVGIGGMSRD